MPVADLSSEPPTDIISGDDMRRNFFSRPHSPNGDRPRTLFPIYACLCLAFLLCAGASPAEASGPTGPRLTWAAFQRFWDTGASPLVRIRNPMPEEGGYLVDYGHTTALHVHMENGYVRGLTVSFSGVREHYDGGPRFLQLMHRALVVGSYRWPEERVLKALRTFEAITPEPAEYRYHNAKFSRSYTPEVGWEFHMDYVLPETEQKTPQIP